MLCNDTITVLLPSQDNHGQNMASGCNTRKQLLQSINEDVGLDDISSLKRNGLVLGLNRSNYIPALGGNLPSDITRHS